MRIPKPILRQGHKKERSVVPQYGWVNNTTTRPQPPTIEIQIAENSTSLTVNITLESDRAAGNLSQPGVIFTSAIVMTSSDLDATSLSTVSNTLTSLSTIPTATFSPSTLDGTATDSLFPSTATATFGAGTSSTLSASSAPTENLMPGLVYASPFTNASAGSSVPLVVVLLRTLLG